MTTPYDLYVDMLSKQSADALVPGQVGMGINSGHQDSDAAEATSSALARNRADMQAMALISGSADGGVGYSSPPPGHSPSMQMQADVKAAAVVDEAIKFAEYIYMMNKQAEKLDLNGSPFIPGMTPEDRAAMAQHYGTMESAAGGPAPAAPTPEGFTARMRALGSQYMEHAKGVHGRGWQAAAIGAPVLAAGGLGYGAYRMMQPGEEQPMGVPDDALKTAAAVLDALGLQAVQKYASIEQIATAQEALNAQKSALPFADRAGLAGREAAAAAQRLAKNPYAMAAGALTLGAGGMYAYNQSKQAADAVPAAAGNPGMWQKTKDFTAKHYGQLEALAHRNPKSSLAVAGGLGAGVGALTMHQIAAMQQAAQMQAAQEAGLARPEDASLSAMKEAALAGQQFALQQMGLR